MSRGKIAGFLSITLLALGAVAMTGGPVQAALTVSGSAGGLDDLAPGPVSDLAVEVDLGGPSATLTWSIAAEDFRRQAAVSGDFTSGGTYVNVNDVAAYNIYRGELDGELTLLASVGNGETSYVDDTVEAGFTYVYAVAAADASENESVQTVSDAINLGPPPTAEVETPEDVETTVEVTMTFTGDVDITDTAAVDQIIADFLAALEAQGIDTSRITNIAVGSGSIVITFDVSEDATDPALDVVAEIDLVAEETPEAFVDVGGAPSLSSTTTGALDFGNVGIDEIVTGTFSFTNSADDPDALLTVSPELDGDGYSTSVSSLSLAVGESGEIDVFFNAADVGNLTGDYPGLLTLKTNDPNNRTTLIDLSAGISDGLGPAEIDLSSESLSFANVTTGTSRTISLTVRNTGDLDLDVTLALTGDAAFSIGTFAATLDGAQASVTDTDASGDGSFSLNSAATELTFSVSITGLTGFSAAHIHGPGAAGVSAGVVRGFEESEITEGEDEITIEGTWVDMTADQVADLRAGLYYVNIHTDANAGGEIRGQILTASTIAGGDEEEVAVVFSPTAVGEATGTITVTSNDAANPSVTVTLSGAGISPSDVEVLVDADGNQILGDFVTTGDSAGKVDFDDFFAFADQFNTTSADTEWIASFDINQDAGSLDVINFDDFFVFADNFNKAGTYQVLGQ